jgi:hypothetical protein
MKKQLLFSGIISLLLFIHIHLVAQVSITTDGTPPDNSAMLDVKSTTKGFLPPRLALIAKNVATPVTLPVAAGLLVYNTATAGVAPNNVVPGYFYWNGSAWVSLVIPAGSSGQTLFNNNGTWAAGSNLFNNGTNVGIGTTSPSTTLEVVGGVKTSGSSTYGFLSDMNTAAADGYGGYFKHTSSGNASNGVYGEANYTGTGNSAINCGGKFISNSTTQDGIGVTGYAFKNDAASDGVSLGGDLEGYCSGTTGTSAGVQAIGMGGNVAYGVYGVAAYGITNWAGYFAGNVMITNTLQIQGGSPGNGKVLTSDATGKATWQSAASLLPPGTAGQTLRHDGIAWVANSILINNGTNIGIGTTSPQSKLDVSGNIALNNNELRLRDGGDGNHGLKYNATTDGPYLYGFAGGALGTSGNPNSLWWNSSGDVNVGNNFAVAKAIVVDNSAVNNGTLNSGLKFGSLSGEGIGSNRTTASNQYGLDFYTNSNIKMSITNTGNVGIGTIAPPQLLTVYNGTTTGTYTTTGWMHSSDGLLKTNIKPIEGSLEKILKLQGVSYNWKDTPSGNNQIGFIAQDVEKVFPEVIMKDEQGNYSMASQNLTAPLVEAIKEQQRRIDAKDAQIMKMAESLNAMQAMIISLQNETKEIKSRFDKNENR